MKIIIFDFEVFKYDTLLGCKIISPEEVNIFQTWDLNEIRDFYNENLNSIWIGWNNESYDNLILQAIIKGENEKKVKKISDDMILKKRRGYLNIKLNYYDLMTNHFTGLKSIEAFDGKNISESEVDFNIDRPLTEKEKLLTESYNRDDLEQTYENFINLQNEFQLRLDMINTFNLPLDALHYTGTQVAELVLKAEKIDGIEDMVIKPKMYKELILNNPKLINFYLNEKYRTTEKLKIDVCGLEHKIGMGGIHAAKNNYTTDWAYYFDVSGYYNLIMINYDLLPRTIPEESKKLYTFMYEEQLRLKKIDPGKRKVYKPILLAVFGAEINPHCKFYDPYKGRLVTITGEIFLVDLLEKLEGKVELIQSNTDGIIAKPLPGVKDEELISTINEWQNRTGFVLKLDKIYDIHQRDVNNYMYRDSKGEIHVLGEALKHYKGDKNAFVTDGYNSKEPLIISNCIVEYFMNGKSPEEIIEENKDNLKLFQYICKKLSFDWIEYDKMNLTNEISISEKVQNVNRAFAYNNPNEIGMLYKYKEVDGKLKKTKISNLPKSVFVYNNEILSKEARDKIQPMIDYDYYILRAYERIAEFAGIEI